ncbi:IS66 family transposase [Ruminococcus gauvreauii]|uniref:IS66 family transposase n=1 Tax=Ruminococcus gauvreauii TaxID=438033 RepID=A0ABY5VCK2_9FIRM|nr:IS66 family transposase [Ruminococcus gauvreauii]UWP57883.1 IS66 family transposase [Ruminococcus gauvreauii]
MWVYRTGKGYGDTPIILYEYQKTRKADHPREFLKGFKGIVVCDGFPLTGSWTGKRSRLFSPGAGPMREDIWPML